MLLPNRNSRSRPTFGQPRINNSGGKFKFIQFISSVLTFPEAGGSAGPLGKRDGTGSKMFWLLVGFADLGSKLGVLGLKIILAVGLRLTSLLPELSLESIWILLNLGGKLLEGSSDLSEDPDIPLELFEYLGSRSRMEFWSLFHGLDWPCWWLFEPILPFPPPVPLKQKKGEVKP